MKVVIAGVSGTLGSYLAKRFVTVGHEVIGISRTNPGISGLVHIAHDLTKPLKNDKLHDAVLINTAALTRDGISRELYETNLAIAMNCRLISSDPQIFVSSSSVYDLRKPTVNAKVSDASGSYPFLNSYSKSKFDSELIYQTGTSSSITLRPHALIGDGDQTLLPRVRRAVRNGVLRLPNSGAARHEFTSFENFAKAVELCLLKFESGWSGQKTLNVSDGNATTIAQAIQRALRPESISIKSIPTSMALIAGRFGEFMATGGREPSLSRYSVCQLAFDRSYDLTDTKTFLGYAPDVV